MRQENLENNLNRQKKFLHCLCLLFCGLLPVIAPIYCFYSFQKECFNNYSANAKQILNAAAAQSLMLSDFAQNKLKALAKNKAVAKLKNTKILTAELLKLNDELKNCLPALNEAVGLMAQDYFALVHSAAYYKEALYALIRRLNALNASQLNSEELRNEAQMQMLLPQGTPGPLSMQAKAEWLKLKRIRNFLKDGLNKKLEPLKNTCLKLASAIDNLFCLYKISYASKADENNALNAVISEISGGFINAVIIKDLYGRELLKAGAFYNRQPPYCSELAKMRKNGLLFYAGSAEYINKSGKALWYASSPIRNKQLKAKAALGALVDLSPLKGIFEALSPNENLIFINADSERFLYKQNYNKTSLLGLNKAEGFVCRINKTDGQKEVQACISTKGLNVKPAPDWLIVYTKTLSPFEDKTKILFAVIAIMLAVTGLVVLYYNSVRIYQIYFSRGEP